MERPCGSMRRLEPSSPDSRLPGLNYLPPLPMSNLTVRGCVRLWVCHHPLKKPSGDKSWILRNTSLVNDSFQEEWTSIWVSVLIVSSLRHHPGVLEYSISIDSHRTLHQTGGGEDSKEEVVMVGPSRGIYCLYCSQATPVPA